MQVKLALSTGLLAAVALALGACIGWTPPYPVPPAASDPTPSPTATATPIPECDPSTLSDGWIYVVFSDDVPGERAFAIVEEVGAKVVPVMMPLPDPPDGYLEVVAVPSPDQEQEYIALFEAYSEVVRALPSWPECTPPCPYPSIQEGWLFVYFRSDVTEGRASEIVEGLGGFIIPVDQLMSPIAYPEPQPGPDEYGELVDVPAESVPQFLDGLAAYPEVTRAEEAYWYQCR